MNKALFNTMIQKVDLGFRHSVPVVHQAESSECGLACLAMICGHYGKNIDLISLRQQFNLSARGATLAGINGIAGQLGMTTRALSLDLGEMGSLKKPCILHWNFNHFVVLVSVRRQRFVIHDPARGRRTVGLAEMSQYFTGVALEIWPGSEFTAETVRNRIRLGRLIRSVQGIKGALIKIFSLSLVIESSIWLCRSPLNWLWTMPSQPEIVVCSPLSVSGYCFLFCYGQPSAWCVPGRHW